jgi:hemoglobin
MKHPDIGHIWAHVRIVIPERAYQLSSIFCKHWGGNTVYRGRDMVTAHRGMGLTEVHWKAVFESIDECYENFNVPQDIREEVTAFLTQFKPAVIGSPSYRDVVAHPDMDVTKGMKSVGIHWPKADKPS